MINKCPNCRLVNYAVAEKCVRCGGVFKVVSKRPSMVRRIVVCLLVSIAVIFGFYLSLIGTSRSLTLHERAAVDSAIVVLEERGFGTEVTFLKRFTAFRSNDNWFNALVEKENAFAATNFPFEIMTLYPDFFYYPVDDTERAAILLHEARHLLGGDEKDAYAFVWKNRHKLGWTRERYAASSIWKNVRKQTREYSSELFACPGNDFDDCTEWAIPQTPK